MNKTNLSYFIILAVILASCSQPDKIDNKKVDTVTNPVYNIADTSHIPSSKLVKLKKLVSKEYEKIDYFKDKSIDSITFTNTDSIRKFGYILNMFPLEKIDSIQFYGIFNNNKMSPFHLSMNSLLILYFNNKLTSQQELDSMNINYYKNFRATESMFKPGGISFEIDNQLVVYSVNTCGPGYRNLQRIDTLINNKVFKADGFIRLHAGCGMAPFKRIEK